jgi:predicted GNAT family acetyltransferase
MKIEPLGHGLEPIFWKHVMQDIPHYYFFAFDWKHNREKTEILLALERQRIDGMMLVYNKKVVQLRGSSEAAAALLKMLDLEKVEIQSPEAYGQLIFNKYKSTLKQSHRMMLMVLHKGEQEIHKRYTTVELDASYSQKIATIMRDVDPEYWGDVTSQRIVDGMNQGMNWLGIRVGDELVSIGSTRLTEWAGLIGVVATDEKHRNRGYATSTVSELVKRILKEVSLAMIFVLADNQPAIQAYTKVGFKPYKTYFFMRGIRR